MLNFKFKRDDKTNDVWVETSLRGKSILTASLLNKGTAFTLEEREQLGLLGKLPMRVETIDEQVERVYHQFKQYNNVLQQNIYLAGLYERNQTLFYKLAEQYVDEILPIIYTPIVGEAIKCSTREFRVPRGLYIAYPDKERIDEILANRTFPEIDLLVASDAEGILGMGDQGICGMDVPIAKLKVYTLFGGLKPGRCLPILLDVGTNNEELLNDPFYLGWRNHRIEGKAYDEFIEAFVTAVERAFPHVFLHWEDFSAKNGHQILKRYQQRCCTFNDDIQGTGAVALAAVLAAVKACNKTLGDQRIVIFGAGNAGIGIANTLCSELMQQGLTETEALSRFWLVDKPGLLVDGIVSLSDYQARFARTADDIKDFPRNDQGMITLTEVVNAVKPTILIGCSGRGGAFDESIVKAMAAATPRPIIFPLSNPTECAEAHPQDLLRWTDGQALLATGTPFGEVERAKEMVRIAQCNNFLVFPGIGLGVVTAKVSRLTESMLHAAAHVLSEAAPVHTDPKAPLLPPLSQVKLVSRAIAKAIGMVAIAEGLSDLKNEHDLEIALDRTAWEPRYYPLKKSHETDS